MYRGHNWRRLTSDWFHMGAQSRSLFFHLLKCLLERCCGKWQGAFRSRSAGKVRGTCKLHLFDSKIHWRIFDVALPDCKNASGTIYLQSAGHLSMLLRPSVWGQNPAVAWRSALAFAAIVPDNLREGSNILFDGLHAATPTPISWVCVSYTTQNTSDFG